MTRAKTQHGSKGAEKKPTPAKLEPIDDDDVDAAFAGIRLDTPSPIAGSDAKADAADAAAGGADFSASHTRLPEVKEAATSKRRAATKSEAVDDPRPPPPPTRPKGTTTPPPIQIAVPARITPLPAKIVPAPVEEIVEDAGDLVEEESVVAELPSGDEWERMRAAADDRAAVIREKSHADGDEIEVDDFDSFEDERDARAKTPAPARAPAIDANAPAGVKALAAAKAAAARAAAKAGTTKPPPAEPKIVAAVIAPAPLPAPDQPPAPKSSPLIETVPPTIVSPATAIAAAGDDNDAALDASLASLGELDAPPVVEPPSFDIDMDDVVDAADVIDNSRAARTERASAQGLPPSSRALDTAAREVAAEQEVALINQAATAREEAVVRLKAAKEAAAANELAKATKRGADQARATADARAQAQARAAAQSGGTGPRDVPRMSSALERALRDSEPPGAMQAPPSEPMTDSQRALERALRDSQPVIATPPASGPAYPRPDSDDFSMPGAPMPQPPKTAAPLPRVDLVAKKPREVSVSDSQLLEVVEQGPPQLQLAVFETGPNLQSASLAIAGAGHAMAVGASGREGIVKIKRALAEGQIDAVLVGMPGGEQIIEAALSLTPRAPVVIAACSGKATDAVREATAAGADLVAIRPHDPDRLAVVLLAAARIAEQRYDVAAAQHNEADLLARLEAGETSDDVEVGGLQPFEHFQRALELELKRVRRYQYALSVVLFALEIPDPSPPGIRGILRARAGNALIHSIRDIDMATEIDQDRFLVLLPYTDITGATEVARRIIAAVDAIPAVVAVGNSFRVGLTGAIAGAKPGTQLSFGKLIKDANRALAAARRDGAELAVQP